MKRLGNRNRRLSAKMRGITFAGWARSYHQELYVTCDSQIKTYGVERCGHTAAKFMRGLAVVWARAPSVTSENTVKWWGGCSLEPSTLRICPPPPKRPSPLRYASDCDTSTLHIHVATRCNRARGTPSKNKIAPVDLRHSIFEGVPP
jgi:hypothetical protein